MTALFASVAGHRATSVALHVANIGPWFADCELDEEAALSGPVTLQFGSSAFAGTIAPSSSGAFGLTSKVRVIGGGGGWGRELGAKAYHNDAGVKSINVATDAAREAGETIGTFSPPTERLGIDYVRRVGPAAKAIEDAAAGVPWWVDYQGKTNVGPRAAKSLTSSDYDLLSFDHTSKLATLGADDPAKIEIGSVLTGERLEAPLTIRELEFTMSAGALRIAAWCGGDDSTEGRLERLFTSIVERIVGRKLLGRYRYRVVTMAPDGRANLQAVSRQEGLPDLLPVSQKPGLPGAWGDLAPGSEVLVEFIAGDAAQPILSGFAGRGEGGFIPPRTTLGASSPSAAADAARKGDTVKVLLPPAVFTGTISGGPATGVLTFPTGTTLGTIETGSSKVGIGT